MIDRRTSAALLVLLTTTTARAQEKPEYLLTKDQTNKRTDEACPCAAKDGTATPPPAPPKPEEPPSPWTFRLQLGSVFQISQNKSVIGKLDGTSQAFQTDVHAEANYRCGDHELRNRLDSNDVIVKTQNTGRWVPASDFVELESIYQYHAAPTVGPFARASLHTSVFLGRDLRTNAVQYALPDMTLTDPRTEYRLTDRFLPLTLLESTGVFYNPVREKHFDVDLRLGFGVREVFANDQLGVKDDAATKDIVELTALHSYTEGGIEGVAMVRAELWKERISTYAGIETLLPLVRTKLAGDTRSNVSLTSETVRFGIAYKLGKSATILYELRVVNQPQLVDVVQIQNNAGFKATFKLL